MLYYGCSLRWLVLADGQFTDFEQVKTDDHFAEQIKIVSLFCNFEQVKIDSYLVNFKQFKIDGPFVVM